MIFDNQEVRRQDRLLDENRAMQIVSSAEYGVLAMIDSDDKPYALPLNFVFDGNESIYIHCAPQGHKLRAVKCHDDVTFVIVGKTQVMPSMFTTEYESVMLRGTAKTGLSESERHEALRLFLLKYSPDDMEVGLRYADKSFFRTEIIRIDISTVSAKSKKVK